VLIHGMGALGKSSLAARVQNRMPQHRPVVIFERYDALAIFNEVLEALDARIRLTERAQWREVVKANPTALAEALESWLTGPLNTKPVLLIIDDLEAAPLLHEITLPQGFNWAAGVGFSAGPAMWALCLHRTVQRQPFDASDAALLKRCQTG
jgi:hypothetical protein